MTQAIILIINLLVLCIGGHIWKGLRAIYKSKGLRSCMPYSFGSLLLLGSGSVMANTFLLHVAELSQSAP